VTRLNSMPVDVWDTGTGRFSGLGDGYLIGSEGVIVMLNVEDLRTFEKLPQLLKTVKRVCDAGVPIVVCANKIDARVSRAQKKERGEPVVENPLAINLRDAKVLVAQSAAPVKNRHPVFYCPMSVASCHNVEMPLRLLGVDVPGPAPAAGAPEGPASPLHAAVRV
jgi:GTPase SAR1 family protein